jgi:hypothetical protein
MAPDPAGEASGYGRPGIPHILDELSQHVCGVPQKQSFALISSETMTPRLKRRP